jgi:hypothetical protein
VVFCRVVFLQVELNNKSAGDSVRFLEREIEQQNKAATRNLSRLATHLHLGEPAKFLPLLSAKLGGFRSRV